MKLKFMKLARVGNVHELEFVVIKIYKWIRP